ncbi:MAG: DUF4012 domain-containing protein [Ktedonobacteraceae bacterium]|nr:DUF4012 domain-containing protein [Ktedonobacteraceae bacterium]
MLHIKEQSGSVATEVPRPYDISSWPDVEISTLKPKAWKRFYRRKAAITAYLTSTAPVEKIAARYGLSPRLLLNLTAACLISQKDGTPLGFRALLPGALPAHHPAIVAAPAAGVPGEVQAAGDDDITQKCASLARPVPASVEALQSAPGDSPATQSVQSEQLTEPQEQTGEAQEEETSQEQLDELQTEDVLQKTGSEAQMQSAPRGSVDTVPALSPLPPARERRSGNLQQSKRQRRLVRQRIERIDRAKKRHTRIRYLVTLALLTSLLLGLLLPLGIAWQAYNFYNDVLATARDGISQLTAVKDLLGAARSDPFSALDRAKLERARDSFKRAEADFVQLQQLVERADVQNLVNQVSPDYGRKLVSVRNLIRVALDVSRMGQELVEPGLLATNIIHGSPLAGDSSKPLVSVDDQATILGAMTHTLYYLDDIQLTMNQVRLQDLPLSVAQKAQITSLMVELPKIRTLIVQNQSLVGAAFWLLGVGHERRFLVQTMDRAELRPGGGFTGQYGILSLKDGRMTTPFTLRDVALLDYAGNGMELGRQAPPEYRTWMNFGNWGLRDSNLSADYPTTARLNMQVFQEEGGGPVDGNIAFTTTFISHILDVTGPIHVGEGFDETITAQNLEDRLHYYQQDYSAIARQRQITGDTSHQARKAFTSLVGKLLLDKVRHLPTKQLLALIKNATKDLESHDLQIYFTNPIAQQWLVNHGYSGSIDTFTKQDGFVVNQANVSISKASQYVHTTEHDDIVLDSQGGATHTLTITLDYRPMGPIYGFDTYENYLRVYAPPSSRLLYGYGFDSGIPLCKPAPTPQPGSPGGGAGGTGGNPPGNTNGGDNSGNKDNNNDCSKYNTFFPSDARYCPNGVYKLGDRRMIGHPWPINSLSGPTASTSDLPGRAMWGGTTVTPKNCISTITLSWYVPNAVKRDSQGHPVYNLLVQKQSGSIPTLEINIDAKAIKGARSLNVKEDLKKDTLYSLPLS